MFTDSDIELTLNILKLLNIENESNIFSPMSILNNLAIILAISDDKKIYDQISKFIGEGMQKDAILEKYINLNDNAVGHVHEKNLFLSDNELDSFGTQILQNFNINYKYLCSDENFLKEINNFLLNQLNENITKNDIISMKKSFITIFNALFVDQEWDNPFTSKGETLFFVPPYTPYSFRKVACIVCEINENNGWNLTEGDTWRCLGIPYKNRQTWLHILLPKESGGLNEVIKKFDIKMLKQCIAKRSITGKMDVIIPAFEIESKISFNQILNKLGITDIFNEKSVTKLLNQPCRIKNILQSNKIKVDQTGLQQPLKISSTLEERKERYKNQNKNGVSNFEEWCRAEVEEEEDEKFNAFRADQSFIYFVTLVEQNVEDLKSIIAMGKYC